MTTPRQSLIARIERLRVKFGPDHLLVKDYKAQLAAMPKPTESNLDRFVGAGTPPAPTENTQTSFSKAAKATGRQRLSDRGISALSVDDEGYKKRQNWSVGTFHRGLQSAQPQDVKTSPKASTFNEEAPSANEEALGKIIDQAKKGE